MFGLPPWEMPSHWRTVLNHIIEMRRQLDILELQVKEGDIGRWPETVGKIRESAAWIVGDTEDIRDSEQWYERQAEEAFYPPEVLAEKCRKREEDKRKREARKRGPDTNR